MSTLTITRSLVERTEAMFRSVDPNGELAQEWKRSLDTVSATEDMVLVPRHELEWMAGRYDDNRTQSQLSMECYDMACTATKLLAAAPVASPPAAQPQEWTDEQWLSAQSAFDDAVPSGQRGFAEWQDRMTAAIAVLGCARPEAPAHTDHPMRHWDRTCPACLASVPEERRSWLPWSPEETARRFHEAYEYFAPAFGYITRPETRTFDPETANGALMIAVIRNVFIEQTNVPPMNSGRHDG